MEKTESRQLRLVATPEPHLWQVKASTPANVEPNQEVIGYVAVYVDDLMIAGEEWAEQSTLEQLGQSFTLANPEFVENAEVTFCGYQIGFCCGLKKYITDRLQRRGTQVEKVPYVKIPDEEEVEPLASVVKEAEMITGELGCVTSRSRPELASVALMARQFHRPPTLVIKGQLAKRWCSSGLRMKRRSSFAPRHEQYRSIQGLVFQHGENTLLWASFCVPVHGGSRVVRQ